MAWSRREFLNRTPAGTAGLILAGRGFDLEAAGVDSQSTLHVEADRSRAQVSYLSWDTEGGNRSRTNLLRAGAGITLRVLLEDKWRAVTTFPTKNELSQGGHRRYRMDIGPGAELEWSVEPSSECLVFRISANGDRLDRIRDLELIFPFDPGITPVTVIPSTWNEDNTLMLPAIVSAPDFGQMLLSESTGRPLKCRLEGNREHRTVDFVVQLNGLHRDVPFELSLTPYHLPAPANLQDSSIWPQVRRSWFNAWQPTSRWGDQNRPYSSPAGILANNVISDPCSMSICFYSDLALWTPKLTSEISVASMVRRTVDWWLDKRTRATGAVIGYWDYDTFLDANAGPLIGAWGYVESTGDRGWLENRIEHLEFVADFLARQDVDGDGMVEATQSGNRNGLMQPHRSCCWFDALNCGHKDGYSNALIYRAWLCLAELEGKLGRSSKRSRYLQLAARLKAAYAKTLYNPKTGWLGWWRSADGELHDYGTPIVNGMAIEYGLVEPEEGRKMLNRLWSKMQKVEFKRFDLGLPCTFDPVHRSDYLLPDADGCPHKEDGSDTFQQYMNGGITAGQGLHFLAAHYVAGAPERADHILQQMITRAAHGGFQNGVRNKPNKGVDWTDWQGGLAGYEGYLADVYYFLQAVLLREASFREIYYRPLRSLDHAYETSRYAIR